MKFLLLLNLFLLTIVVVKSATTLRIGVITDPQITTLTPIDTEIVPALKNLTLDYLLVIGSFTPNVTDTNPNSTTIQNIKYFFTKIATVVSKSIFWIPGELDGTEVFQMNNFTTHDVNVNSILVNIVPGFYVCGLGEMDGSPGMDFSKLSNLITPLNQSSTVILLTNKGPTGFATTLKRSNVESIDEVQLLDPSQWTDTGNQNLTNFLSVDGAMQHVVLNVHGGNPQGIGDTSFGDIRIINPGSAYFTESLVMTQFIKDQMGSWVLNNWKFYRFGNITAWGPNPGGFKMSVQDSCTMSSTLVSAPYVSDIYSKISIALYSFGIVAIVVLLTIWVAFTYGSEQV